MSTTGNKCSKRSKTSNEFKNIFCPKGAIAIPADVEIVEKESAIESKLMHGRKRKSSVFGETVIGKKSILELNTMVDKNRKHINFLSECGKLTTNRESVLLEDIQNLQSIIQQKKSVESCNGVSRDLVTSKYCSTLVSSNIYK